MAKTNLHSNRFYSIAIDDAIVAEHPLNKGRIAWWIPGLPGTPTGGKVPNLCPNANLGNGQILSNIASLGGGYKPCTRQGAFSSIQFDATNAYVDFGNIPALSFGLNDFTIQLWVKWISNGSYQDTFETGNGAGSDNGLYIYANANNIQTYGGGDVTLGSFVDDVWTHFTFTRSGVNATGYVTNYNGSVSVTSSAYGLTVGNTASLRWARANDSSSGSINGAISEASVWNRVLSTTEITESYALSTAFYFTPDSPIKWFSTRTYSGTSTALIFGKPTIIQQAVNRASTY